MKLGIHFFSIFLCAAVFAAAEGDMIIRGETMRHDTKENITIADGGSGFATADWGANKTLKKLQAKIISAKTREKTLSNNETKMAESAADTFGQDIEWLEARDHVQVTFPNRTMTADYCKSQGKKINCIGNVTIISGKNHVKGDKGSFDLENDQYEISTNKSTKQQVEATLYSTKNQVKSTPKHVALGA